MSINKHTDQSIRDYTLKRRDLNVSHTFGCTGRNNSKSSIGSTGHVTDTKKPKDLSVRGGDERGPGVGWGVYDVCKCERVV